ncbi:MAG: hypothetical protein D6711_16950 [Chloroflexi bacterium]|nr:MAG: hypothetical protein D6711_16950 [Chloroflexota bacterium]
MNDNPFLDSNNDADNAPPTSGDQHTQEPVNVNGDDSTESLTDDILETGIDDNRNEDIRKEHDPVTDTPRDSSDYGDEGADNESEINDIITSDEDGMDDDGIEEGDTTPDVPEDGDKELDTLQSQHDKTGDDDHEPDPYPDDTPTNTKIDAEEAREEAVTTPVKGTQGDSIEDKFTSENIADFAQEIPVDPDYTRFQEEQRQQAEERRVEQDQYNWLEFGYIRQEVLKKNRDVFVDTSDVEQFFDLLQYDERRDNNIYIVTGEPESGRYATAIRIACELAQDTEIREYTPDITTQSLTLFELISRINAQRQNVSSQEDGAETKFSENSVIIIEDAFNNVKDGQSIPELTTRYANQFRLLLGNVRLILTTTISPSAYPDMSNYLTVRTTTSDRYMSEIYDRHVDYYFPTEWNYFDETREILAEVKEKILQRLTAPVDIDRYMDHISKDVPESADTAINIADTILEGRNNIAVVHRWFNNLAYFNQKLYVMFAVLFDGLNRYQLDDLYDEAVAELRANAPEKYDDPRYISVRNMLNDIHMKEQSNQTLSFIHNKAAYERVVLEQMDDYYRLLWDLSDLFVRRIEQTRPGERRLRRLLATVLGRIGVQRQGELQDILTKMTEGSPQVAEAVTYVLVEIANYVDNHDFLLKILRDWLNSHKFHRMMSAISALSGVYQKLVEKYPHAVEFINDEVDVSSSGRLDENTIAANTLRQLRRLLEQYCNTLNKVDTRQEEHNIYSQRDQLEKYFLEAMLRHRLVAIAWASGKEMQQEIRKLVAQRTEQELKRLHMMTYLEYTDQLMITAVYRIADIAEVVPHQMVTILREWLAINDNQSLTHNIARMAVNRMFMRSEQQQMIVGENQLILLDLLPDILQASEDVSDNIMQLVLSGVFAEDMSQLGWGRAREEINQLVNKRPITLTMHALDKWYEFLEENVWRDMIYPRLLHMVNTAKQITRTIFADSLINSWLDSAHVEVRRSAMALLTRAYILNGSIVDLPLSRQGVVMIDKGNFESNKAYDLYISAVFNLVQHLAALSPVRVFHMGYASPEMHPLQIGKFEQADPRKGTLREKDLKLTDTTMPLPLLIMPFIDPVEDHLEPINPEACHYVLMLNMQPILDWGDAFTQIITRYEDLQKHISETNIFLMDVPAEEPPPVAAPNPVPARDNPFASPAEQQTAPDLLPSVAASQGRSTVDEGGLHWEWYGKFIFNAFAEMYFEDLQVLPDSVYCTYQAAPDNLASKKLELEQHLQQQIIANLRRLPLETWLDDLHMYCEQYVDDNMPMTDVIFDLNDFDVCANTLGQWLGVLNDVKEIISPRDVTLSLAWGVLLLSQMNLEYTVALVTDWLNDAREDFALMGRACTKQLFNFYGAGDYQAHPDDHAVLLQLLPPFMSLQPDYHEFGQIIFIILKWAEEQPWTERLLTHPEGEMPELIAMLSEVVEQDDIDWLVNELEYRSALWRVRDLVIRLSEDQSRKIKSVDDYIDLMNELIEWVNYEIERRRLLFEQQQQQKTQRRRGRQQQQTQDIPPERKLPQGITLDMVRELLELPGLTEHNQQRIFQDIRSHGNKLFRDVEFQRQHTQRARNLNLVMDSMRLQLFSKNYQLPPLEDDKSYAVVFVDTTTQTESYREQIAERVIEFLQCLVKHEEGHTIVPVIHRMGRSDAIYTHQYRKGQRIKVKISPEVIAPKNLNHRFVSIIGPALSRYPIENVGFVLIFTGTRIWDIPDWTEDEHWRTHMFRHTVGQHSYIAEYDGVEEIFNNARLENKENRTLMDAAVARMMSKRYRKVSPKND